MPFPKMELAALFKVGKGEIQGVQFDLTNGNLVRDGWRPTLMPYSPDPFIESGLGFPWGTLGVPDFKVKAGDLVIIDTIKRESRASEFDHASDQEIRLVRYGVIRKGEKLALNLPEDEFCKLDAFLYILDFQRAISRIKALSPRKPTVELTCRVGDEKTDPAGYIADENVGQQEAEHHVRGPGRDHVERAIRAAHIVNASWGGFFRFANLLKRPAKQPDAGRRLLELAESAIDHATSCGYWLAKAEFEAHISDAKFGKDRKASYRKSGKVTGKAAADRADAQWRRAFLELAQQIRAKHGSYGHDRLIRAVKDRLKREDLPSHETLTETIKRWERSGELSRSTRNPATRG